MNENKIKTVISCHKYKYENQKTRHGCKIETLESCSETFNRNGLEMFQIKNMGLKTENWKVSMRM